MDFDCRNAASVVVNEDRLSSLPDELICQILSCIDDTKFVVQTCLLSPRWKLLWKSVPRLNFFSEDFDSVPKFANFVTSVLSHRNHQIEVSSVKLCFHEAAYEVFMTQIANYVFSHNVQELTVVSQRPNAHYGFPACFFSSPTLKHFSFCSNLYSPCVTPKTPWDFPALTTLHLRRINLCDNKTESVDLFSKCVNLKTLTLECFFIMATKAFDIMSPRLSNLMLITGRCPDIVNVIAPQLENLIISHCEIKYLNAPPGLSSLCYIGIRPPRLPKDCFHSLNKVTLAMTLGHSQSSYEEEDALETINFLQELHSTRFLSLFSHIVECLSSFPDLLSHLPSPFSNLVCLNLWGEEAYEQKMSTVAKNFLLKNSPRVTSVTGILRL